MVDKSTSQLRTHLGLIFTCTGYLDHPFLKNRTQQESNQAF